MKLIQQGAEAKIFLDESNNTVIKDRISKSYRIKELDDKIRKQRTKSEKKILEKASKIINAPKPLTDEQICEYKLIPPRASGRDRQTNLQEKIIMPFIDGKKLSEHLDSFPLEKQKEICKTIGQEIAKLHNAEIIHGDLTTSNMILKEDKIFFIDFGLGHISRKVEDKAVDLHLLKQALEAKHFKNWETIFKEVIKGYKDSKDSKKVLERLEAVEKRGRYKEH